MADDTQHIEPLLQRATDRVLAQWSPRDGLVMGCEANNEAHKVLYLRGPCYDALMDVVISILFGPNEAPAYPAAFRLSQDAHQLQLRTNEVARRVLRVRGITPG